jgi:triosephosphate isomerase
LDVILCVGETLEQRQAKQTEVVLDRQLSTGLAGVPLQTLSRLSIAYEPVWAIGSLEHHATPQQAQHAQLLIRAKLTEIVGEEWAEMLPVHYGGSVEPENAASFLSEPGIDGVLIGGASLKSEAFLAIVEVAVTVAEGELQAR